MNKKFRDIAEKYGITQEVGQKILLRIKIENSTKNPSKNQLEGFELVCQLLKKGMDFENAIASCLAENEVSKVVKESKKVEEPMQSNSNGHIPHQGNGSQPVSGNNSGMNEVTGKVGKSIAQAMYQSVPGIAQTKFLEMKGGIEQSVEQNFVAMVLDGNFGQEFEDFVNTDLEKFKQGKLNPPKNNSALPPGS